MTSLKVIELGGGAGTAAVGILDTLGKRASDIYESMKYCSIDVSEVSLSMQHDAILNTKHENVWCRTNNPVDVTMQKCKNTEESWRKSLKNTWTGQPKRTASF